ncbi:NAD(P)/FAD-dependent oxidoreductase [Pseudonocardia spinosispora]|uniref:NAD(P)/FAD-dependent oxidoreductase n=1 Tax=Pseudonocardia spinosispora TaxID=103441 RepID=UPI00055A0968|nr:FAD-dependent oxidoreductase [Pseudonocardia spinosispora]
MASPDPALSSHADLLIVGGGPAARSCATAYREHGGAGAVVLVSGDTALPYFRPALSKEYLRGESEEDEIALSTAKAYREQDIAVRLGSTVRTLDVSGRSATLADGTSLTYGDCVLATGAAPAALPVPGADDPRVRYLRSVDSARELRADVEKARTAVVVGSGFIGCEAAVSIARRGVRVTMISQEELPQQARLGAAAGARIAGWLSAEGVQLVGGAEVGSIEDAREVRADGADPVSADLVLVAAGVRPCSTLAESAGVRLEHDRVVVDDRMRSGVAGLFAAGDVAYAHNAAAGRHLMVEHWGEAEAMGAVAGANAAGGDEQWAQAPGFWSMIGDHTVKHVAWGDGYDEARMIGHRDGAFTVWYIADGIIVGVLTHNADEDYERGRELVEQGSRVTGAMAP